MSIVLKSLTIPAITKHTATVIFLHGLGDSGYGWKPVVDMYQQDQGLQHVKWVLPHAFTQPVTANMGMEMPTWFDIYSFGFKDEEDKDGMLKSKNLINQLVKSEIVNGINSNRIFLGGFSQGGAMTLLTGLTGEHELAGLAVLSGWLPLRNDFKAMVSEHAARLPIFWGHGRLDPLVEPQLATSGADILQNKVGISRSEKAGGQGLSFNIYEGLGHSTNAQELEEFKEAIKRCIPADT